MVCTRAVAGSGYYHIAFVDAGGQLLTCGGMNSGRSLGQGPDVHRSEVPRAVAGLNGVRVISVAAGWWHTLAVSDEGTVYSFGDGSSDALGHGDEEHQLTPRRIESLGDTRISAVAAGGAHSLALTEAGELYSFGWGEYGLLGHGDRTNQLTPRRIEALRGTPIAAVAAGGARAGRGFFGRRSGSSSARSSSSSLPSSYRTWFVRVCMRTRVNVCVCVPCARACARMWWSGCCVRTCCARRAPDRAPPPPGTPRRLP